ncbi:regulatory LuxR family protein [Brevibacterium sanguinis]|uniref:Regulatory LuxR family protein n=2 Tax=Brevibacterium TaxID=1696 RepID=A0A366II53_9MICO|nr:MULTISPECIES: helix-turn-helix transcriptional regulator [Brevibacterium]RBP64217.1 regulatory LuxR family protein [Brevibacterium sanguinis]RBP71491.1 regulatory LuxR family protein [Brevibacterium celere]
MTTRVDLPPLLAGAVSGAALVIAGAAIPGVESALLVPALFVLAGVLGPLWQAAALTCRLLVAIGAAHSIAFAAASAARIGPDGAAWWHLLAQLLFVSGFALLVVLASAYPAGPVPGPAWWAFSALVLPLLAAVSGPTPAVLGEGRLGPITALLPSAVADAAVLVFALPPAAAVIAVTRFVRDGRDVRGRLTLPLAAVLLVGVLLTIGALVPGGFSTAAFLLAAPLLPVALVAGSRTSAPAGGAGLPDSVAAARLAALTPREREVLALMAEGRGNVEIGRALHISLSAVEKHSTAIFSKLGVSGQPGRHRRVAAVVTYLRGTPPDRVG